MKNIYPLILLIGVLLVAYIVFALLLKHLSNKRGQILDSEMLFTNELLVRKLDNLETKSSQYQKKINHKEQQINQLQAAWQEKNNQLQRECKQLQKENDYLRTSYHKDQEQIVFTKRDLDGLGHRIFQDFLRNLEDINNQAIVDSLKSLLIYEEEQRYKLVQDTPFLLQIVDKLSGEELNQINEDFNRLAQIFYSKDFASFLKYGSKEQKAQFIEQVIERERLNQVSISVLRFALMKIELERFPKLVENFQSLFAYIRQPKSLKFILAADELEESVREELEQIPTLATSQVVFETDPSLIKGLAVISNHHQINRTLQHYFEEYIYELEGVC